MERPKVKDYYWKNATLDEVSETYNKAPNLFKYAQALDMYIDDLEDKLSEQQTPTEASNNAETKQLIIADVSGLLANCPNCGQELQLEVKEMTNKDIIDALQANNR